MIKSKNGAFGCRRKYTWNNKGSCNCSCAPLREIAYLGATLREIARQDRGISFIFHVTERCFRCLAIRGEVFLVLSPGLSLVYVLHPSGLVGRLARGRVSRNGSDGLLVYDQYGRIIEYLSEPGGKVRSWCLLGPAGKPVDGWSQVLEHDRVRVFPFKDSAKDSA